MARLWIHNETNSMQRVVHEIARFKTLNQSSENLQDNKSYNVLDPG